MNTDSRAFAETSQRLRTYPLLFSDVEQHSPCFGFGSLFP